MSRRKKQGWINYQRKPFIIACLLGLGAYWYFVPDLFPVDARVMDVLKGFGVVFIFADVAERGKISAGLIG